MSEAFMRWFVVSAVLVGSLHAGEAFHLLFDSSEPAQTELFAATPTEEAAPSRS
ncbi:MAG: hypothetical protein MK291_05275 [Planctomycetes bacterium]|nr:hypothetical protein [Planctomycetota bacterium]